MEALRCSLWNQDVLANKQEYWMLSWANPITSYNLNSRNSMSLSCFVLSVIIKINQFWQQFDEPCLQSSFPMFSLLKLQFSVPVIKTPILISFYFRSLSNSAFFYLSFICFHQEIKILDIGKHLLKGYCIFSDVLFMFQCASLKLFFNNGILRGNSESQII